MNTATYYIDRMIDFAIAHGLVSEEDRHYSKNLLLDALLITAPEENCPPIDAPLPDTLTPMLEALSSIAVARELIPNSGDAKERFSTRLSGLITPAPAMVRLAFWGLCKSENSEAATDWFYQLCRNSDYIRVDQIKRNQLFTADSPYGELEITINLSKPEKDPKDIIAERNAPQVGYPLCMLCVENPGYAGRPGFPARQNHRMIPLKLKGKPWYFQYSPYLYYEEHCIVLNELHVPMHVDAENLGNMFDFVDQFPHYFIGSNADLPIVGGSILSHDHFQGGRHVFPMDKAAPLTTLNAPAENVRAEIVNWPMSCIRLRSEDAATLQKLAGEMLDAWRAYSDPTVDVLCKTDAPHNTITPVLRKDGNEYILNLVLRNNRTTAEHPMGIFHPHEDLHHVKKENIGLIEVMGLFILPGRLLSELDGLSNYLTGSADINTAPGDHSPLKKHYEWAKEIAAKTGTSLSKEAAEQAIQDALAKKCTRVLEDAGVFKLDDRGQTALLRFLETIGYQK